MCLLVLAYRVHPAYPLVVAANRDEFYDRPSEPAQFWHEAPQLLAGRDLTADGTWLGMSRDGRFAAVTNYREARAPAAVSRGHLVRDYLQGAGSAGEFAQALPPRGGDYAGFNLLLGDVQELWWYSNRADAPKQLAPGIYGLSNHLLDSPWPKVLRGKAALAAACADPTDLSPAPLLALLGDRRTHATEADPISGMDADLARALSAVFIDTPHYGTRCSTVLLQNAAGRVDFVEDSHLPQRGQAHYRFFLDTAKGKPA